jgi:hypothetical protein
VECRPGLRGGARRIRDQPREARPRLRGPVTHPLPGPHPAPTRLAYRETWRAFEKLYAEGLIKAIGVSNFKLPYLDRLLATAEVVPAVHQSEVHPTYQQAELDALEAGLRTSGRADLPESGLPPRWEAPIRAIRR